MIYSIVISILAIVLSLTSIALNVATRRRTRQHQRAGDNSMQIQVGHRNEDDYL